MSTYQDEINNYQARVQKALELGLEPSASDVRKLCYYEGRARKKGPGHSTKTKDKVHWIKRRVRKSAKTLVARALEWVAESMIIR